MSPAGLLALVLGTTPAVPPTDSPPTVADAVRRWAESAGPYNPTPAQAKPTALPADVAGRARLYDLAGRSSVSDEPAPVGRVAPVQAVGPAPAVAAPPVGFVYEPTYDPDTDFCPAPAGYQPQVGDIVLVFSDHLVWKILFAIALIHEPYHTGIVVRTCDGNFGMLEAGPPDVSAHVRISPLAERLASDPGRVYIRRRCIPLTAEQADTLNGFAARQDGKPYAYLRFLAQGTPLRSRGPVRTEFMGRSRGEPCSYFCSELVVEALVSAGLIDPETARPRATAPSDIFYDESTNPWINKYLKLFPWWCAPQRWVPEACPCDK
jgi:hypothetical protein